MTGLPVALDANGIDGGPELAVEGARLASADGIGVRVFGPASLDEACGGADGVELEPVEEWIGNDADPVAAVRSTPGSSIVRAAAEVAEGRACALVSAGSTGATMTAALFALKRIKGVHRPALAAQVPVPGPDAASSASRPGAAAGAGNLLFLDVGANTEVRAPIGPHAGCQLAGAATATLRSPKRPFWPHGATRTASCDGRVDAAAEAGRGGRAESAARTVLPRASLA